jgi:hypothetical protein
MKIWVPLALSVAFAAALVPASTAKADPFPPRPRDEPGRHDPSGARPGDRPGDRPDDRMNHPPGWRDPGMPPILAPNEYQTRLQRFQDERFAQRMAQRHDERAWELSREQRALDHRRQLEGLWGVGFIRRPEVNPEMALNADRCARLDRMIELAQDEHDLASEQRARAILAREIGRHARAMARLRVQFGD